GRHQLLVKNIVKDEIEAEKKWTGEMPKRVVFIEQTGLLIEDWNKHLCCMTIKQNLEGHINTFKYLGVLHTTLEYLTQGKSAIMKNKIDGSISVIAVNDLEYMSPVQPAIYEPDMLMAYQAHKRAGLVHVISLQENNKLLSKCNPTQYMTASKIAALSFAYKGKWLIVASNDKAKAQLIILDWKAQRHLYTYDVNDANITEISYTDQLSEHPCIFETARTSDFSKCLYSCDPIKLVAASLLNKAKSNNNNETKIDINKN
ncbi:MAG TPA: hypothetical protein VJ201_07250, partial [Candidatus Babeliales bacterium]|nr:hypothetical protein [Candidatus Babeliales bacterium]